MADQKIAVVTGATSGLGEWVAFGLAQGRLSHRHHRPRCRPRRGYAALDRGARAGCADGVGAGRPVLAKPDAAGRRGDCRRSSADRRAGEQCRADHAHAVQVTAEGREMILAVNHLAPFVLTTGAGAGVAGRRAIPRGQCRVTRVRPRDGPCG